MKCRFIGIACGEPNKRKLGILMNPETEEDQQSLQALVSSGSVQAGASESKSGTIQFVVMCLCVVRSGSVKTLPMQNFKLSESGALSLAQQ